MISFDQLMLEIILIISNLIVCHHYDQTNQNLIDILLAFIMGNIFILLFRMRSRFSSVIIFRCLRLSLVNCQIDAPLHVCYLVMHLSLTLIYLYNS